MAQKKNPTSWTGPTIESDQSDQFYKLMIWLLVENLQESNSWGENGIEGVGFHPYLGGCSNLRFAPPTVSIPMAPLKWECSQCKL